MPDSTPPLLEVRNLSLGLRQQPALPGPVREISFTVHRGEQLGLVGESGSGKTLTCLAMLRLLPAGIRQTGGTLRWHGGKEMQEVEQLAEPALRALRGGQIGMIFQDPQAALNPVFTCGRQIGEVIAQHRPEVGDVAAEVRHWLMRVRLDDPDRAARAYPWQLSGGQRQRVMVAMALAGHPRLVIADEPTSALDVLTQRALLDLILDLRAESKASFLFVSHDLALVEEMADRVLVMRGGRIVERGEVVQVMRQARHPYTRGLLACRPRLDEKLQRLPVMSDFLPDAGQSPPEVGDLLRRLRLPQASLQARRKALYQKPPCIEVSDLHVEYVPRSGRGARTQAVRGLSFSWYPAEILGVVGASGSGKTTLGKALLGLLPASAGQVQWKGRNVLEYSEKAWRRLRRKWQMVFQDAPASLNPRHTVGQIISEPLLAFGLVGDARAARPRVAALLSEVQLREEMAERYPHQLSGGERQRVALARALALEPEVLICDEPVSALDVSVQAEILNVLQRLNADRGLTCLFIAHDLAVVQAICDRMLVMREGQLVETGLLPESLEAPQHPYTQMLRRVLPHGGGPI